ncbi:D-alanyl-D-alanine carboxypeptidase (penicillin-binding protein 5/6) [Caloramator quimbayensis]|uniref:serine-type D-Ala-D-Ala carboxypeptidase n=1 Tax=Caloramator quimbayensis TaxID=1147123 RepID=A0A1T4WXV6_9CLOT|nr:D-alanyl-D-alanine carboxypeptidase family protein [Caloramator quimbayensis]SKA82156.1 D-alanyl-D-alanine carboxypeptidase (penicillin-binding protein 5/6) [Caloramator quimbayensis]
MKYRKILSEMILCLLFISIPCTVLAEPDVKDTVNINCKSAILVENSTGKVIYEKNSHEKLTPASVTKIMTMLLTMEAVDSGRIKLTDKVVCSERAKSMGGSTMFLDAGEIRTVEELLKGVAVESANDAAIALAEYLEGTEEAFVEKMNLRAKELSMNDTHFNNCTGLFPDNHYSSAYDIAIMSRELLKHTKILDYTKIWMETISEGRQKPFTLINRNKMLKTYKNCDGLKTGYIKEALYCISATAERNGIRFISVIMGSPSWKERNADAGKLLDLGFAKYERISVMKKGEVIESINIPKALPEKIDIAAKQDLNLIVEKGSKPKYEKKLEIIKDIKLPLKKGDKIGVIKAVDGNNVLGEVDAVAACDVNKMKVTDFMKYMFKEWIKVND